MIASLAFALMLAASPADPAQAIAADPPIDTAHPASSLAAQFKSHGATINAQVYRPAGAGVHPTVLLFHGLPGNEQNLDLARALQRAGWTVVTFHYRGSWGSGGDFTLAGGVDDAEALIETLRDAKTAASWGVDPAHLVVAGHSYGGYIAAATAARHPEILASVLIAPWDPSYDQRAWSKLSPQALAQTAAAAFDDVDGRLGAVTVASLTDDLMQHGASLDLTRFGPALANRPVLIVNAVHDDPDDQGVELGQALTAAQAAQVKTVRMDTDHPFNDHRIALETEIVRWLPRLPAAPIAEAQVHTLKNVEILVVERSKLASGIFHFVHRTTVRTSDGRVIDLFSTSLDPERDRLPEVGDRCDVRYTDVAAGSIDVVGIKHRDTGADLPLVSEFVCGGRRITPGIVDRKSQ